MEDLKDSSDGKRQCVICGDNIEFYSIGQCNHNNMCYYCTLKERTFYNNRKCPLCNTILDIVFISPISETKTFEELSKNELSSYYKDNDSDEIGVYYTDISSLEASMQLKSYKCPIEICVKEEPFDTYEELLQHLWDNHQRFFCKVCVKDGKKFISEQKVYSKNDIKEHNLYGDMDEDIPPHAKCPFCGDLYYNDEFLYKHMSNSHFMCEICKSMDKTIIFYSALPNLIQHNKLYHYCCPFKECQDVLYIAFFTRKQLIQHFENKHNQKSNNLNEKMADENKPRITEDPTLYDISMKKDEFNFTNFLEKVNKRCIQHRENKNKTNNEENSNTIDNNNNINTNFPKLNMDGVEIIYKYQNYNYDNYNGGPTNGYEYEDYYRGRGRGGGRGRRGRGNKMWNNNYGIKQTFNTYEEPEDNKFGNVIKIKELDYEFILRFFVDLLKKYLTNYITKNKILENEIYLPRETQFQLIMIIDKINDKKKILELYNIQNFGIDWDTINILKDHLIRGDQVNENDLYKELDLLPLKNILIIYQYLLISYKKISGKYYKLEMDQINENFYKNFFPNSKKNKNNKLNGYNRPYSSIALSHELSSNNNNNKNNKKKKNKKWNQMNKNIIGLNKGNNDKKPEKKEKSEIQMKKDFDKYIQQCKKEDEKLEKEKKLNNKNDNDEKKSKNNNKNKLAMLIGSNNNKNSNNNKKVNKPKNTGEFKLSYFNMDEDFPPLK